MSTSTRGSLTRPALAAAVRVSDTFLIYWPDIDEEIGLAGLLGVSETALEEAAGFTIYNAEPSER